MKRPVHGGNLAWAATLAGCPPDAILDFSASINPLGPPASALDAIQAAFPALRAYPDPGYTRLCDRLSQWHGISPEWVLPGNGSAELLTWACRELAEQPATVLVTPAFGDYGRALRSAGAIVHPWPMEMEADHRPPVPLTDGGVLLNNPHNPTGHLWSREELQPLIEAAALVVVDEAFMDFLPPGQDQSVIDWVARYPQLVVLRSLTKFYSLPGLRLGYAIAHPDRLHRWQQWRDPWPVNALAVAAAEAVIADQTFQQSTWDWLAAARPLLAAGLTALPGLNPLPGVANFLLVRSQQSVPPLQAALLRQHRVLIRDCLSFPELGDRYFRVAIRTLTENEKLLAAVADVL